MRQEDSQLNSTLLNGCGCLCLVIFMMVSTWIALPSFVEMAYKAKRSEAKQYVGSMNRAQQAKFAEKVAFATSIDALGLGIKTETKWYKYSIRATKTAVFHYALAKEGMLKNHVGAVFLVPAKELYRDADRYEMTTVAILCETNEERPLFRFKPVEQPTEPTYQNGEVICGKGTTAVTK